MKAIRWGVLCWLCLSVLAPEGHAAPAPQQQVSLDLGNAMSDAWNQPYHLAKALRSNPRASRFLMTWVCMGPGTSAVGAVVYNRRQHTLRFRTTGGHTGAPESRTPSMVMNYQFDRVTDAKLLQLGRDELGVGSISGSFEKLTRYGCRRHTIKQAYWF